MKAAVKIIKRGQNKISTKVLASQGERADAQSTREIVKTVKGWISELHQRHRDEQVATSAFRRVGVTVSALILSFCGLGSESKGQQLRDAFHKVEEAVVIVKTEQQGLAPFPQVPVVQSGSYDAIYSSISRLKPGDNLVISVFRQGRIVKLLIPVPQ